MLLSYHWLRSLLPDLTLDPADIALALTQHSFETVVSSAISIDPKVTIAKITKIKPHPNADRLQLVTIDTGQTQTTVVCGARNIQVGDVVPYAPVGTCLIDDHGQTFTLAAAKIRSVISAGMLASPRELGLGKWHGGIYLLPAATPPGSSLADHLPPDTILTADISPNRAPDCLSHLGVARELAAILNLTTPNLDAPPLPATPAKRWQLNINLPAKIRRYIGLALHQIVIQPSPLWLQARLWAMGSQPLNNVIDITNYVMFETGYPSHAFDSDKMPGRTIGVRLAQAGEPLTTLDRQPRRLTPNNLVITADDKPVAIAGVIGGRASEVGDKTTRILLETAAFHPYTIQQSARDCQLDTESSRRFSKGITPALVDLAAARAVALLQELAGACLVGRVEYYPSPVTQPAINFRPRRVSALAGQPFTEQNIKRTLTRLRCQVITGPSWTVTPPIDRLDLTGEHDLIEEVIRLTGLQNIASHPPRLTDRGPGLPDLVQWREIIRDLLVKLGLTETSNYSFSDSFLERLLDLPDSEQPLTITNAIAPEQSPLRLSLLPRLAGNLLTNQTEWHSKFSNQTPGLFEIGTTFRHDSGGVVPGVVENEHVAFALVGDDATAASSQAIIDAITRRLGISQPPRDAITILSLSAVAKIQRKLRLPVMLAEINLSSLLTHATAKPDYAPTSSGNIARYQAPSKYPPVYRDLAILVDPTVAVEQIQAVIARAGGPTLLNAELFDTYQPKNSTRKSLAFHLAYQAKDRTMTDGEVNQLHQRITERLGQELGAKVRE